MVSASVLPDGHLVIANRYGVFSVSPSVSEFNLDKSFFTNVLTKLEAVMGFQIESVLATMWEKLTNMSKVTLQNREDKRTGIKISVPDLQKHPVQYVQELIHQWSLGLSTRPATWRELLQVMQDIGQLELCQQIETFLKGESSYFEAYHHFIGMKESLDMLFLKFLFLGPPRNGKTTVRRRLLKEIVNLISAGEADQSQPSTGIVESSDVVVTSMSGTTAVITESEWSALTGLVDEARMLMHSLMNTIQNTAPPTDTFKHDDSITLHQNTEVSSSTPIQPSPTSSSVPVEAQLEIRATTPLSEISSTYHKPSSLQEIPEAAKVFSEAMESEHWKNVKHLFKAYMKIEDTGGQPELMDMLPALTFGPGLYLLFINLQYGLDHHYKLSYCNASGESTPPIESVYSVKEMLLSSLSSISCSNATSLNRLITSDSYMKNSLDSSKSVAFIVGTHKDKASTEQVKKLNEDLKKVIIPTQFYKQDIVQFASEDDLIIALDNMAGGTEEVSKVRKILEDCMTRHFKKLKIPAVWLFFSLFLRHHDERTTSLEHCMQLSSTLGMSAHETEVALWFLHHHAGVLMYFPNVPELKDLVIIDVRVVYDSVTILILEAMNYYKVDHSSAKTFKNTGKFTLCQIIAATRGVSGDHIPAQKLVVLLEFLHIITPVSNDQPSLLPSSSVEEVTYMMPCILKNATTQELDVICQKPKEVPRILFPFKCGAVPIGVFPALIACLTSNPYFKLIQDEIYKNIVRFHFGDFSTLLTLVCRQTYYECFISKFFTTQAQPHKECGLIRNEIESTLSVVSSRVNYGSFMDYELAFDCPLHHADRREHFCLVDKFKISSGMMLCQYNADSPMPVEIPMEVKVWFGEISKTK